MSNKKTQYMADLIKYRKESALETYEEALIFSDNDKWNVCVNRLYYACFYAVTALLIKHGHSSAKQKE